MWTWVMCAVLLCALAHVQHARAASLALEPLALVPERDVYSVIPHAEVLEDPASTLTVEDAASPQMAPQFRPAGSKPLNLGLTSSAFWLRFAVTAAEVAEHPMWILDLGQWCGSELWIVRENPETGQPEFVEVGEIGANRYWLPRDLSEPVLCYAATASVAALHVPARVVSEKALIDQERMRTLWQGVYYGILATMLVVNLVVWVVMRDRSYLWYILFVSFIGLYFLRINNLFQEFIVLPPGNTEARLTYTIFGAMVLCAVQFTRSFLLTNRSTPILDKALIVVIACAAVLAIGASAMPFGFLNQVSSLFGYVVPALVIWTATVCVARGFRPAQYFLIAWAVFAAGALTHALVFRGVLPFTKLTYNAWQISSALEVALLSLALNYRIQELRKEREDAVAAREQAERVNALQSLILDTSMLGIAFVRGVSYQWVNARFAELIRRPAKDIEGAPIGTFFADARTFADYEQDVRARFRRGETVDEERMLIRSDGTPFWGRFVGRSVDPKGPGSGSVWMVEDVTERRQMEAALRESEERLRNVVQSSPMGILVYDLSDEGRLILADRNTSADRILRTNTCGFLGRAIEEQFPLIGGSELLDRMRRVAETGESWHGEEVIHEDQAVQTVLDVSAFRTSGRRMAVMFQDITSRKQAETERERLITELQDALARIKTLHGLLPICAHCKKIRDDEGYWQRTEEYISEHSGAEFTHAICPECAKQLYPGYIKDTTN